MYDDTDAHDTDAYDIPRDEWTGHTAFARRNKACVFRKITNLSHFVISPCVLELRLWPETPTLINWNLKIQNTAFWCNKFPPPILSPLHSTRGPWWCTRHKCKRHRCMRYRCTTHKCMSNRCTRHRCIRYRCKRHKCIRHRGTRQKCIIFIDAQRTNVWWHRCTRHWCIRYRSTTHEYIRHGCIRYRCTTHKCMMTHMHTTQMHKR